MKEILKNRKGITLIALIVTIIVLLILAGISIGAITSNNGIINQAKNAKNDTEYSQWEEQIDVAIVDAESKHREPTMEDVIDELINKKVINDESQVNKKTGLITTNEPVYDIEGKLNEYIKISQVEKAKNEGKKFDETTTIEDVMGNKITIPSGFKIAEDSGDTVQEGIVIEDVDASSDVNVQGSQFVWIPVGTVIKDDGSESKNIELGRYSFEKDGTPILEQSAENFLEEVAITSEDYDDYYELSDYRAGGAVEYEFAENATALDLEGFIESTKKNGGYYIGRFESSIASNPKGEAINSETDVSKVTCASKISFGCSTFFNDNTGDLFTMCEQLNASKICINTYKNASNVKSDLMNSYSWDTTLVYIQEMGHENYANNLRKTETIKNTGETEEEVCHIFDFSGNLGEWTTEYCDRYDKINDKESWSPCTVRNDKRERNSE